VNQWTPQIRTNLDDAVYARQLDDLLDRVPGAVQAGLVNIRFQEACVRLPRAQPAADVDLEAMLALTTGLFADANRPTLGFHEAFVGVGPLETAHLCFREETVLVARLAGQRALVLTASASLNQGSCATLLASHVDALDAGDRRSLVAAIDAKSDVLAGAVVDLRAGEIVERYDRFEGASLLAFDAHLARVLSALMGPSSEPVALRIHHRHGSPIEIKRAELVTTTRRVHWSRMQFDPEHLMVLSVDRTALRGLAWVMIRRSEVEVVRLWVDGLLRYGIKSTMSPFPANQNEFLAIVEQLRGLDENDLLGRLDVGGFANHVVGEGENLQRCQECIYYLPNGKWCDLPELPVPVEPDWWCRLWKI
jgi:hypothetical protein